MPKKNLVKKFHDTVIAPVEKATGKVGKWFHKNIFVEEKATMPPKGKSHKKGKSKKGKRPPKFKHPKSNPIKRKGAKSRKGAVSFAVASNRGMRPKVKTLKTFQKGGLTLNGGTITGVVEVTPSLQVINSAANAPGNILALIPIHAQTIAPGTRLSDIAAMYDQYVFDSIWFELDCATNYIESGTLLGFVEANATDVIGAVNTQVGNITEWVDHGSAQIHPIAKGVLTFPRQGSYMKRVSKGPKGGMYINTVIPTTSASSLSVMDCFQGQFVLMIHNAINTQGGQALSYPIDLGALRCHFKLRLREAAERQQENGAMDEHLSGSGTTANPLGWTTTLTEQTTMQVGSNLGFQSKYVGNNTYAFQLPPGRYYCGIATQYSATGAADWNWAWTGNQTGISAIDVSSSFCKLSTSSQNQNAWVTVKVSTAGVYNIFTVNGSSTGWTFANYGKIVIMPIPNGINTLLKHKDLELRSLAWVDHQEKQDQTSDVLRAVRAELGLEQKKSTSELEMQRKYRRILYERSLAKERQERRFAREKRVQSSVELTAPEHKDQEDDWDEQVDIWEKEQNPSRYASIGGARFVPIYEPDPDLRSQHSDRDEVKARAPGSSRPSSLKSSSGGKDKS